MMMMTTSSPGVSSSRSFVEDADAVLAQLEANEPVADAELERLANAEVSASRPSLDVVRQYFQLQLEMRSPGSAHRPRSSSMALEDDDDDDDAPPPLLRSPLLCPIETPAGSSDEAENAYRRVRRRLLATSSATQTVGGNAVDPEDEPSAERTKPPRLLVVEHRDARLSLERTLYALIVVLVLVYLVMSGYMQQQKRACPPPI